MKRHIIFSCILLSYVFLSNFLWLLLPRHNPYINVQYEVEMDSVSLNQMFYNLANVKFESVLKEKKDTFWEDLEPQKEKGNFKFWVNHNKIEIYSCVRNNGVVWLTNVEYTEPNCRSFWEFLFSDGYYQHDYIVWRAFEKEVLDELDLKYKKKWVHLLHTWYAEWFFRNQLYIMGLAILIYLLCSIIRNKRQKKGYGNLVFLFCLGTIVFWSDILHRVVTYPSRDDCWGEVCYEVEMDSAKLVPIFHKLASDRYELLFYEGQLWKSHIQLWNPDRKDKYSFIPLDDTTLWVSADIHNKDEAVGVSEIYLSGGELIVGNHFAICSTFEKEVLDELSLNYKKHLGAIVCNWYPRWFFHNQLYIIGISVFVYVLCLVFRKRKQTKRDLTLQ